MANNVPITAGSGTPIAADDVSSVWYQRVKLVDGTEGSTADITGDTANGLDVDVTRTPADPASDRVAATKSDATPDPAGPFRGFIMDAEGALKVTLVNGQTRTYPSGLFAAKTDYTLKIARVWSTGTGTQTVYGIV